MEFGFHTLISVYSWLAVSLCGGTSFTDHTWHDVVVTTVGRPTTLPCVDPQERGDVTINWKVKSLDEEEWKLVLSASGSNEFSGSSSKASMRLSDATFQTTGVFSLFFLPKPGDQGLYSCQIKPKERKEKERITLLALLTEDSILRLIAKVSPEFAVSGITWVAPGGDPMRSEQMRNTETVAKLPRVSPIHNGAYVCEVHPRASSNSIFSFTVDITVDVKKKASFKDITHGHQISTAALAHTSVTLSCPAVQGDYVLLLWQYPDTTKPKDRKLVYQYNRWSDSSQITRAGHVLQLAGPPYNARAGSFSFQLTPGLKSGGLYICKVYLNDNLFCQRTMLSVLKVRVSQTSAGLQLWCHYSEMSQVQKTRWIHQNQSSSLHLSSVGPGIITVTIPLPINRMTAGNYTCTLQLKNGHTVWAVHTVEMAPEESAGDSAPSLLPSLSALLLLVPLVAVVVAVLLWRQGHVSRRGIEQSLSHHSGEAENIYENPEDMRLQTFPQGSVYMDLTPRGGDDVYKELDRSEECQR